MTCYQLSGPIPYFEWFNDEQSVELVVAFTDSAIMLWKRNDLANGVSNIFLEEDEENKETWSVYKVLR